MRPTTSSPWCSEGLLTRSLDAVSWLVLDLETTGLDPCRHVIRECAAFSVSPRLQVGLEATWRVDVDEPDGLERCLVGVAARVRAGAVLVAHNIAFDLSFLAVRPEAPVELIRPGAWMCTLRRPGALRRLEDLAAQLGVSIEGRHTAVGDARALADVLVSLLARAEARGALDVGSALADGHAREGGLSRSGPLHGGTGWGGVRAEIEHVVPMAFVTTSQRTALRSVIRLLAEPGHGPAHPVEHNALVAALNGAAITRSALDLLLDELDT